MNIVVFGGRCNNTIGLEQSGRARGVKKRPDALTHRALSDPQGKPSGGNSLLPEDNAAGVLIVCYSSTRVRSIKPFPRRFDRPIPCLFAFFFVFLGSEVWEFLRPELIATIPGFLLGYVIGSFPTAYLLVRWKARLDIRRAGSGSVGAMNAFDVTSSKLLGVSVLAVDLAKGIAAVWLASRLFGHEFWVMGVAGLGSIVGHNYSVWLRFRGGRGLATAAGVMLVLSWMLVVLWCLVWIAIYAYGRNVHVSNISASILSPALTVPLLRNLQPPANDAVAVMLLMSMICLLILVRHVRYFAEFRKLFNNAQ